MPELAEVEYYRKRWDPAKGQKVIRVELHADKRIFRNTDAKALAAKLPGSRYVSSSAHGKQMLFRFEGGIWIGLHLGMSGELRCEPVSYEPLKHDHLVLYTKEHALVFADQRLFGLVLFEQGKAAPAWWTKLPPAITSEEFSKEYLKSKLARCKTAPIKAILLDQAIFPGVGNWVADEILWQAKLHPGRRFGSLSTPEITKLWKMTRYVCETALKTIGEDMEAVPKGWLFDQRWGKDGCCPKHQKPLERKTIGGRTSAFCSLCQK